MRVCVPLTQFLAQQVLRPIRAYRRANQGLPHQKSTNEPTVFFGRERYAHRRPRISAIQGRFPNQSADGDGGMSGMVGERLVQTAPTIEARWWYFLAFNPRRAAHTSSHRFGIKLHMHTLTDYLGDRTPRDKEMA